MPDPFEKTIERLLDGHDVSRRHFVRTAGAGALAVSSAGALLSACGGTEGTDQGGDASEEVQVNHPKTEITDLKFSNWTLYIDKKVLKDFEKKHGGDVKYVEDINDNDEFNGKVQETLRRGDSINRDLAVLTDWMAARWIRAGWIEPIDKKNVPNAKNLEPTLASPKFDPKRQYTMPWQSGMTAIGYNPKKTGRKLGSVKDLFDPKFKGRVTMMSDWRDSAGLVLLSEGKRTDEATLDDVMSAIETIEKHAKSGQIRRFTGNDYTSGFARGDLWAVTAWSGDVVQLKADNPALGCTLPSTGHMIWSDNFVIPNQAKHKKNAETLIDFYYDPEVFAGVAAWVNYIPPVKGTKEALTADDPDTADNELIFPNEEVRGRSHVFRGLSEEEETNYNEQFQSLIGA
jgi:spermidine/putrescine transport system substrate-binding protein